MFLAALSTKAPNTLFNSSRLAVSSYRAPFFLKDDMNFEAVWINFKFFHIGPTLKKKSKFFEVKLQNFIFKQLFKK